ncbi:MAG: hemerythrin domain-containing protein [Nitrosomonadales bacterium]|nr:hemerythrin domain-containing protein [Nitrosomonadales bacterium]
MQTISQYLSADHHHCDNLFADAEAAASANDIAAAQAKFASFRREMLQHLAKEEKIMFPAFEQATGSSRGPTSVMRMEHEQMRELFAEMQAALDAKDTGTYAGLSETLLILMQQHNMKEEQMLYPMADRALREPDSLIGQMSEVK